MGFTDSKQRTIVIRCILLLSISLLGGCASNMPREDGTVNTDPIEPTNRVAYSFNDTLDRNLLIPIAQAYANITPDPIQAGVTNFFDNIAYLNVILNSFLQGKFNQSISDLFRFLFNSTLGIGGLFDVATDMGFQAHDEDFGQTLAVWGIPRGAYLYIPVVEGPNTVRNLPNIAAKWLLDPFTYLSGSVLFPISVLNMVNKRANFLDETSIRDEAALDPYSFTREAYLQQREFLIYDGNPPADGYDSMFDDFLDESSLIIE